MSSFQDPPPSIPSPLDNNDQFLMDQAITLRNDICGFFYHHRIYDDVVFGLCTIAVYPYIICINSVPV